MTTVSRLSAELESAQRFVNAQQQFLAEFYHILQLAQSNITSAALNLQALVHQPLWRDALPANVRDTYQPLESGRDGLDMGGAYAAFIIASYTGHPVNIISPDSRGGLGDTRQDLYCGIDPSGGIREEPAANQRGQSKAVLQVRYNGANHYTGPNREATNTTNNSCFFNAILIAARHVKLLSRISTSFPRLTQQAPTQEFRFSAQPISPPPSTRSVTASMGQLQDPQKSATPL